MARSALGSPGPVLCYWRATRRLGLCAILALAICGGARSAWAAITPDGDTTVAPSDSDNTYAGKNSVGTLTIDGISELKDYYGYLGYNSGSTGTATVTGAGSKWTSNAALYVGRSGSGTLNVEAGGQISSSSGVVGFNSGSMGAATVTGAGSKWTSNGALNVGYNGSGTLKIDAGGQISSTGAIIGFNSDSTGAATVTGAGSKWTSNGILYIGRAGSGTLNVEAGGQVSNTVGCLGYNTGTSGMATVTGAGSTWTNSRDLYVGRDGSGSLTVSDGGLVTANTLFASLADLHGNGTIQVNGGAVLDADLIFDATHGFSQTLAFGSGGQLNLSVNGSGSLGVGHTGVGSLRIADGKAVTGTGGYLGYKSGSTGTATVTGAGSKWTNSSSLNVGYNGSGTLNIEAGGQVSNTTGYLGYTSGATGTATVTGAGSKWTNNGDLYVGRDGSGCLTVSDGGFVTANTLFASLADLRGNGTIQVNGGAVLDADLIFDATHGFSQTLAFGSGGILNLAVNGSGPMGAGYTGIGSLRIADGKVVTGTDGYLGYKNGSTGTATVKGAGSKWTNSSNLNVGYNGRGALNIEAGGQISNTTGYLGYTSGATGAATVTGAGSNWTNSGALYAGYNGSGTLNVEAGGQISNTSGYLGYNSGATGTATVTGAGSKWTNNDDLYVGRDGSGSLTVSDGAQVSNTGTFASSYLGYNSGSMGAAKVTGAGSQWTNNFLYVGNSGSGTLNVEAGGQVRTAYGSYLGYSSGSTGAATVTGAGSKWTDNDSLYVGNSGSGSLTVSDGGLVTAKTVFASLADLHGNGTIETNGAVLDADLIFDATHGLSQAFAFGSGGTLNLAVNGSGFMGAGHKGVGALRIADGQTVAGTGGYLGNADGSTGTATVTGAGSKWTNSSDLYVGNSGSGTLNIEAGGQVSNSYGYLGYNSGATGTATVIGAGSKWTNRSLYVGDYGSGSLTVSDGGLVTAKTLFASLADLHGNGMIQVNAAVLDADLIFDATHGLSQTFAFGSGGILNLVVDGAGSMGAGYKGSGSLRIADGQVVKGTGGYLGYKGGSTGTATVTGAGSKWTNSGSFYVGNSGNGTLNIVAGGQVSNTASYLGCYGGSTGAATVTGAGSTWTNSGSLYVGGGGTIYKGTGILSVGDGGQVSSNGCFLGYYSGSTGTATVTGVGSKWTNSGSLYVGGGDTFSGGLGTLTIEAGGQVSNSGLYNDSYLGYSSGSTGTVMVTGAESKWTNSGDLYVGYNGSGTLNVEAGGQVSNTYGHLGDNLSSTSTATVTGAGSKWTNSGNLSVGFSGTGTLTIDDGGSVSVGSTLKIYKYSAAMPGGSMVNLAGGALTVGTLDTDGNPARFHWTGGALNITGAAGLTIGSAGPLGANVALTPGMTLNVSNGITMANGSSLGGSGTVSGPNALAKAMFLNGNVNGAGNGLDFTGYVKGVGTFSGLVTFSGTYAPGMSPTSAQLENMRLTSTSTLLLELGGTTPGTQYDVVNLSGTGTLDGTLDVQSINGFTPSLGNTFDLLNGTTTGAFAAIRLPTLADGLTWDASRLYLDGSITVTAVPEPGTLLLLGVGSASLGLLTWRRRRAAGRRVPR